MQVSRAVPMVATVAMATVMAACSAPPPEPVEERPLPPSAEQILESLNGPALGLKAYPCDIFETEASRCFEAPRWFGVSEGRETFARLHRQLLGAGAYFWGSSGATTLIDVGDVAGLTLGCYFDYEALDATLRLAVVGPTGEGAPCVNGLPGDGVSEVWIMSADFSAAEVYGTVQEPEVLDNLLLVVPPQPARLTAVYGGDDGEDGYVGPVLPAPATDRGVTVLMDTVLVAGGMARGLVQYNGNGAPEGQQPATAAVDITVALGNSRYAVPFAVLPGESAPFEVEVPEGLDLSALTVAAGWTHSYDEWRGVLPLSGPTPAADCLDVPSAQFGVFEPLTVGKGQQCFSLFAQATTQQGVWINVEGIAASFDAEGHVVAIYGTYLVRDDPKAGGPSLEAIRVRDPNQRASYVAPASDGALHGVWLRYVKDE